MRCSTVSGQLAALVVVACYQIVSVALWGRTLGKLVAGTKIVSAETFTTPGWRAAIVRWAVTAAVDAASIVAGSLSGLIHLLGFPYQIVVYSGILSNDRRQGLHDRAANTIVVRTPSGS